MKTRTCIKAFAGIWLCSFLFYWWLVSKVQGQQLGAAVAVGGIASAAVVLVLAHAQLSFAMKAAWIPFLLRLPAKVLHDISLLSVALWRAMARKTVGGTGAYKGMKFNAGGTDAKSAGRRALVFAGVSFPPNMYAIKLEGNDSLLVHQLVFDEASLNEELPA